MAILQALLQPIVGGGGGVVRGVSPGPSRSAPSERKSSDADDKLLASSDIL